MSLVKIRPSRKSTVTIRRFGGINLKADGNAGGNAYAEFSYNFDMGGGDLKSGIGADLLCTPLPERPSGIWFYRRDNSLTGDCDDRIIIMGRSGKFYESGLNPIGNFTQIAGLNFSSEPIGVCYNYHGIDSIIFASAAGGAYIYDGTAVTEIENAPPISSACIHYERLFATSDGGKSLWFSDDFDPLNWSVSLTEAGFIDMSGSRGEALKVMSFADALFVFRSYGITKVSAYGDQTQFAVSDLFLSSGKIFRDSVTYCGDRILFMSSDGFYSFNGVSATRILSGLDGVVDYSYQEVKGEYFNGKAYFIVKAVHDESEYLCLLVYDVAKGDCFLSYGMNVKHLCLLSGKNNYALTALSGTRSGIYSITEKDDFMSQPLKKLWKSKFCDFGLAKENKVLSKISFYTDTDITLTVDNGSQTAVYTVCGGRRRKTIAPKMLGDNFSLEIYTEKKDARVSAMTLEFEYYR